MAEKKKYTCKIDTCSIENGGNCADGHNELAECPNASIIAGSNQASNKEMSSEGKIKMISLNKGDVLSNQGIYEICKERKSKVIVIAGENDSGKTTFIASIYERLQKGSFAEMEFVGSKTLPGFEKRCFLARVHGRPLLEQVENEGSIEPDTLRSRFSKDPQYLHLRVSLRQHDNKLLDFLFADMAGESFKRAMKSTEECKSMTILKAIDSIALCIDGKKLIDRKKKNTAVQNCKQLLRNMLDSRMLDKSSNVIILFTMYDLIHQNAKKDELDRFIDRTIANYKKTFSERVGFLSFHLVAARPPFISKTSLEMAHGVDSVLADMIMTEKKMPIYNYSVRIEPVREIDTFRV